MSNYPITQQTKFSLGFLLQSCKVVHTPVIYFVAAYCLPQDEQLHSGIAI